MRVLILGVTGFAGSHLADYLGKKNGIKLYGTGRWKSKNGNIVHLGRRVQFLPCDVMKVSQVRAVLEKTKPDRIFHLAGQSSVQLSWKCPKETLLQNFFGTQHLFEAVRQLGMTPLIHLATSSEEYGLCRPAEIPITEETLLRPVTPYAVSKAAQDLLGFEYYHVFGQKIVRTRAFNHTGPRQTDNFVASNFARQVALVEAGRQRPVIFVGNLSAVRDFTDVRDVVRAYWLALDKGTPGEAYNVCSGKGHSIEEILRHLLKRSRVAIQVKKDPARLRKHDVPRFIGDPAKFRRATGWVPRIPFEKTLDDLLNYWRSEVRRLKIVRKPFQ